MPTASDAQIAIRDISLKRVRDLSLNLTRAKRGGIVIMFSAIPETDLFPKRLGVPPRGSALTRQVLGRAVLGGIAKGIPAIESGVPIVGGHTNWNVEVVSSAGAAEVLERGCLVVVIGFLSDILGYKVLR